MLNDVLCLTCQPGSAGRYSSAPFPSINRPRGVLTLEAFAFAQRRGAGATLQTMVHACWRVYRNALTLIRPGLPLPDAFAQRPDHDLGPLLLPWDRVCVWCREHVFDRQLDLFTCPHDTELTRWQRWVDTCCTAVILDQPLWDADRLQAYRQFAADIIAQAPGVLQALDALWEGEMTR